MTRELGVSVELDTLLERIDRAARSVLDCERATVFLYDRERGELFSRFATGVNQDAPMREIRFPVTRGIAGEVARTGAIIDVPDAYADPRFNREVDRTSGFHTRNILACPLRGHDNAIVGVLQVLNKRSGPFDQWDKDKVQILGAQAGVAVQRQFLLKEFAVKQRIQADLNIARSIQQRLLPERNPTLEGFDVAGWNRPANETGGDCYDFFVLPDGHLAITLADATGHGIGPALVIAETRALFRAAIHRSQDLAGAVTQVNALLCDDLPDDRFVTAFFGLLTPQEGRLVYLSAGQGPLLALTAASGEIRELPAHGLPLGIIPDTEYEAPGEIRFAPGDMMMLFTDGFYEWEGGDGEQFGTRRLQSLIRENRAAPAAGIIEVVYKSVVEFACGAAQPDDLTAVIIKRT